MRKTRRQLEVIGFLLVIVLEGIGPAPQGATAWARSPRVKDEPVLIVGVYNYAHIGNLELREAEGQAWRLFARAGVSIVWVDCALEESEIASHPECSSRDVVLRLLPASMSDAFNSRAEALGAAFCATETDRSWAASVFHARVASLASSWGLDPGMVLGDVAVHELGHLLLGPGHARVGIMQANWTPFDLERAIRGELQFTSQQAALLRQAVQARIKHEMMIVLPEVPSAVDSHTEIPFKLYRDYTIIVQGSIGGLRKCNLLIDTGAVPSVLNQRVAKKLHLEGKPEDVSVFSQSIRAQGTVLPELQVGPIQAEAVSVLVRDLSFIEEGLGVRVDAMVGLDVLGRSDFSIDYAAKKLVFGPVEPLESAFAIQAWQGFVYATLQVQGHGVRLLVDTGANHLVLFSGPLQGRITGLRALGTRTTSNLGGAVTLKQVQLQEVHLGTNDFPTLQAFLLDNSGGDFAGLDGLLGVRSLGLTRLSFDFSRQTVSWK